MCIYCEDKEKIAEFVDKNEMYVDGNELNVTTSDGRVTYTVDINYCPICGKARKKKLKNTIKKIIKTANPEWKLTIMDGQIKKMKERRN